MFLVRIRQDKIISVCLLWAFGIHLITIDLNWRDNWAFGIYLFEVSFLYIFIYNYSGQEHNQTKDKQY